MSFLFKKVAAQDGNSEFIIEHSRIPIAQLGGEENAKKSGYIVAKKNGRTYGVHIDGYSDELTRRTLKDAGYAFDGCEGENAAQDSLPTVGGYITLKKDGKKYKILKDWGGGEYIVADPNGGDFQVKYYEHLEGLKHYGKDAAEFKVGDKVKHTQYGTIGKVFEIDPAGNVGVQWNNGQAYYGRTAKPLSLIIAADSAAMDSGDYATNANALVRMAFGNLNNASRVALRVIYNIGDALSKVKDKGTKDSLKELERDWGEFRRDIDDMVDKISRLPTPPGAGIPHKEKIPPDEREILKQWFK